MDRPRRFGGEGKSYYGEFDPLAEIYFNGDFQKQDSLDGAYALILSFTSLFDTEEKVLMFFYKFNLYTTFRLHKIVLFKYLS